MTTDTTTDVDLEAFMPEDDTLLPPIFKKGVLRHINVTLDEIVITEELKKVAPGYDYDRGFLVNDRDFTRLATSTSYNHAFNMTRRAVKLLFDNVQVDSVTYKFPNGVRVTYNIKEITP